jgi:hypothetical protein
MGIVTRLWRGFLVIVIVIAAPVTLGTLTWFGLTAANLFSRYPPIIALGVGLITFFTIAAFADRLDSNGRFTRLIEGLWKGPT